MLQTTDAVVENQLVNLKRRNENIDNLKKILLHGESPEILRGILFLEERGIYVCAYLLADKKEGDYAREEIPGDLYRERDRVALFCKERDCLEERRDCRLNDAIPSIPLDGEFYAECVVVDISKFSDLEKESAVVNLSAARDLLVRR